MEVQLYDSTYCRLCAENNSSGVFLYSSEDSEPDLSTLINKYLPLKVCDDGKLPRTICPGCNIQLQATVQFFDLLVEGQKKIRELWKQQVEHQKQIEKAGLGATEILLTSASLEDPNAASYDGENRVVIQIMADGTGALFRAEHEISLKMEGLDRPRPKKGRPKKSEAKAKEKEIVKEKSPEPEEESKDDEGDLDGRRRRKRKVPKRFTEVIRGKELERMFREEGVIDEDDQDEGSEESEEKIKADSDAVEGAEIIGHLETPEGQDLGELVIVNKAKGKGRPRGKRRKSRFQCEICGRSFLHRRRYFLHKSFHKGVKYECTECQKRFSCKEYIELHQKQTGHTGEGIVEGLEDGENEEHPELKLETKFTCEHCDKAFMTKHSYEMHIKAIHEGIKPYVCEVCGKTFAYANSIKTHMAIHEEPKSDKGIPCEICGKTFNHTSSLIYHREADHNNGRRFVCNKCGKGFKHKQLLQRHQLVHSDNRPFACKTCGATFKAKANLLNHMPTHTGEKKYFCELCGHQFAHKTSLTLHYRWHTGQKPYQCHVCNKSFSQNGNLQEHLRIHTGEKPFCCDFCGRKFTTSSQFKLHVKRHTGERPWKCEYCNKSFLHKDTWKCHTRRHRGERPFQCHYCARGFTEQWALKKHLRLHTGEKPYTCNICGKAFADCSNLTKHKKVHRDPKADNASSSSASVDRTVWNIIRNHLTKEDGQEGGSEVTTTEAQGNSVEQIIYVTYQDPDDPNEARTLHFVENVEAPPEQPSTEAILQETTSNTASVENKIELTPEATYQIESAPHALQVMDEDGNPIQFTMQDGRALQITTVDGQAIHVTTPDGQSIPVQLATSGTQVFSGEIASQLDSISEATSEQSEAKQVVVTAPQGEQVSLNEHVPDVEGENIMGEQTIEFTTPDGQKLRLVASLGSFTSEF
ncbi:zinc finger protein 599-like [Schistocerca cancellata]|uniref:zinc finger protein 599-like n=1 Tax=Schistocerca cancellata TaxID=274614 RepID=UPI002117B093|nr:zinc finger protein 599-like [Schistocerca cancellata]